MRMKNEGLICGLEGCGRPAKKRGHCETHYQRLRIHGDVTVMKRRGNRELMDWILQHKTHKGDDCLIWPFTRSTDGRGQITVGGKNRKAPRIMCEVAHGAPPTPEHQAAHSCGKGHTGCISPDHLSWKTRVENEADKMIHGTRPLGVDAWNAKLTADDVQEIRRRSKSERCSDLAKEFGVHPGTISQLKRGITWEWLPCDDAEPFATAIITAARLHQ